MTQNIVFIQNDIPPLRPGSYALTATQTIPNQQPGTFKATSELVVQGERFSFKSDEIQSVFPPNLAIGEFDGVFPHVVLNRRTLPWERLLNDTDLSFDRAPWLAVLLFDDANAPVPQKLTVNALLPTGTLPPKTLSYGAATLLPLGYGESLDDTCMVIDIPRLMFNQVAPAEPDLQYLAHIREVDSSQGVDSKVSIQQYAVVIGNRIPAHNTVSHAFLVSLENMGDYLPPADGTQSTHMPSDTNAVRLITFCSWTFTANAKDRALQTLLENLNTPPAGQPRITTLQMPIVGAAPTPARVTQALAEQAAGQLSSNGANVLAQNALQMGYVPFNHHLRHGGQTFSWYRGPLAPYAVPSALKVPISDPDAANRYNPQTGLFDVSYGMAWQLGQMLALQNGGMANDLYRWKRSVTHQQVIAAEQALLEQMLPDQPLLESFLGPRAEAISTDPPPLPASVTNWFGSLAALQGVPFNYLVPDERLLPAESIRFFHLDLNWIDALIDGAFSIGRTTTGDDTVESLHSPMVRMRAKAALRARRPNLTTAIDRPDGPITGFVMRSQAITGWPNLRVKAFSDTAAKNEIKSLGVATLSKDVLFCLFGHAVEAVYLRVPPEALHLGVEGAGGTYTTTLRRLDGDDAGQEYGTDSDKLPVRGDGQTFQVADAATAIKTILVTKYNVAFPKGFSSAEFAVEMTKGVVEVEYRQSLTAGMALK